jgi:hypothetical protein
VKRREFITLLGGAAAAGDADRNAALVQDLRKAFSKEADVGTPARSRRVHRGKSGS